MIKGTFLCEIKKILSAGFVTLNGKHIIKILLLE